MGRYCKAGQVCLGRLLDHQHFQFGGCSPDMSTCLISDKSAYKRSQESLHQFNGITSMDWGIINFIH